MNDIVAELDRWLQSRASLREATVSHALLEGAREEIVALRRYKLENAEALGVIRRAAALVETTPQVSEAKRLIRAEALEEAAHECDEEAKGSSEGFRDGCETCAAAIRALKQPARAEALDS